MPTCYDHDEPASLRRVDARKVLHGGAKALLIGIAAKGTRRGVATFGGADRTCVVAKYLRGSAKAGSVQKNLLSRVSCHAGRCENRSAIYTFGAGLARQRSKTSTITVGEQFPAVFYVILPIIKSY
jgi:hypothetical protein